MIAAIIINDILYYLNYNVRDDSKLNDLLVKLNNHSIKISKNYICNTELNIDDEIIWIDYLNNKPLLPIHIIHLEDDNYFITSKLTTIKTNNVTIKKKDGVPMIVKNSILYRLYEKQKDKMIKYSIEYEDRLVEKYVYHYVDVNFMLSKAFQSFLSYNDIYDFIQKIKPHSSSNVFVLNDKVIIQSQVGFKYYEDEELSNTKVSKLLQAMLNKDLNYLSSIISNELYLKEIANINYYNLMFFYLMPLVERDWFSSSLEDIIDLHIKLADSIRPVAFSDYFMGRSLIFIPKPYCNEKLNHNSYFYTDLDCVFMNTIIINIINSINNLPEATKTLSKNVEEFICDLNNNYLRYKQLL